MAAKRMNLHTEINGLAVSYDDLGSGATPVLFIHGFPFDKSSWKAQMEYLQTTNRVIAYDIRGFGQSSTDGKEMSISLFADDLIAFMNALQIEKAVLCGLSMGGYILLNAVNRFPDRVNALVLADTQCIGDSPEKKQSRAETIAKVKATGVNEFANGFIKSVFCKETLDSKPELVEEVKAVVQSTSADSITGCMAALAHRADMCSLLGKITVPTLILCGTEDVVTPPAQSETLQKGIANSQRHLIPRAGHLSNLEQPEEFNQHLVRFISEVNKA